MTNMMINNLISQRQQGPSKDLKQEPVQNITYEAKKVGATVYSPKGYIVKTPLWKAPIVAVQDGIEEIKSIGRGMKGDSNDHELGKMNDIAMKTGGLAIASYLASTRVLPVKKGMEFVGFAAFLAGMGASKLLIDAPIKALYGFDNNMKYVDSQGRKKPFHRDPLYVPWDLVPSEEINRIGDRMKIDPMMENREEFIKNKVDKISTQSNTMWMLTAGLTTPIIGALLASAAEKGLNSAHKKVETSSVESKINKLGANFENLDSLAEQKVNKNHIEKVNEFLNQNKGKEADDKFFSKLAKLLNTSDEVKIEDHLTEDLKGIFNKTEINDMSEALGDIKITVQHEGKENPFTLTTQVIKEVLEKRGVNSKVKISESEDQIKNGISDVFHKQIADIQDNDLVTKLNTALTEELDKKLKKSTRVITKDKIEDVKGITRVFEKFRVKHNLFNEFLLNQIGQKEDSVCAREWGKASERIIKALGLKNKDLEASKKSSTGAADVLDKKMLEILADESGSNYSKTIEGLAQAASEFDDAIDHFSKDSNFVDKSNRLIDTIYTKTAEETKKLKLDKTTEYLSSKESIAEILDGGILHKKPVVGASAQSIMKDNIKNSLKGAKGTIYQTIQVLDMYKRIQELEAKKEISKETAKLAKHAALNATYGDHYVKLDIPDHKQYKKVMNVLYSDKLSAATEAALNKNHPNMKTKILNYSAELYNQLGNSKNKFLPDHVVEDLKEAPNKVYGQSVFNRPNGEIFTELGDRAKQMMKGDTPSNFIKKIAEQKHNTNTWLRTFGAIGGAAALVAVISPVFFGKMDTPKPKKEVSYDA